MRGSRIAVATRVHTHRATQPEGVCGAAEVRLVSLKTGFATPVAQAVCSISTQHYESLAFAGDGAFWTVRRCATDNSGCVGHVGDPLRVDPATFAGAHLDAPRGRGLAGMAVAGSTVVTATRSASGTACGLPRVEDPECYRVTVPADQEPQDAALDVSRRVPPDGYSAVRSSIGRRILGPPVRLPCLTSGPQPVAGGEVWTGALLPGGPLRVRATSGAREIRAVLQARRAGQRGWVYAKLDLGGTIACGRTWQVTYRVGGRSMTLQTAIAKG